MAKFIGEIVVLLLEKKNLIGMKVVDGLKKCSKCGEVKKVEEFGKNKKCVDSLHIYCKICQRKICAISQSRYRNKFPEKVHIATSEWRAKNKSHVSEYNKIYSVKYRSENKEVIAINKRMWQLDNPDKIKASSVRNRGKTIIRVKKWGEDNRDRRNSSVRNRKYLLYDSYIRGCIVQQTGISSELIPPELIEIKRTIIKTKRLCKTLKNSEVN